MVIGNGGVDVHDMKKRHEDSLGPKRPVWVEVKKKNKGEELSTMGNSASVPLLNLVPMEGNDHTLNLEVTEEGTPLAILDIVCDVGAVLCKDGANVYVDDRDALYDDGVLFVIITRLVMVGMVVILVLLVIL
ncbi:hypothetical protein ACOSQ4_003125 [Xanthoceras sorbifolium]